MSVPIIEGVTYVFNGSNLFVAPPRQPLPCTQTNPITTGLGKSPLGTTPLGVS